MADRKILSCAAGALVMGALSAVIPAAWAVEHQVKVEAPRDLVLVRQIDVGDLNLASAKDANSLNDRVRTAVANLCTDDSLVKVRFVATTKWRKRCRDHAWDEARPQISAALRLSRDVTGAEAAVRPAVPITITSQ